MRVFSACGGSVARGRASGIGSRCGPAGAAPDARARVAPRWPLGHGEADAASGSGESAAIRPGHYLAGNCFHYLGAGRMLRRTRRDRWAATDRADAARRLAQRCRPMNDLSDIRNSIAKIGRKIDERAARRPLARTLFAKALACRVFATRGANRRLARGRNVPERSRRCWPRSTRRAWSYGLRCRRR